MPPLLTIQEIYHEPGIRDYARSSEILAEYPDAKLMEVKCIIKYNQTAQRNDRYKNNLERDLVKEFVNLCTEMIPYCSTRYAF